MALLCRVTLAAVYVRLGKEGGQYHSLSFCISLLLFFFFLLLFLVYLSFFSTLPLWNTQIKIYSALHVWQIRPGHLWTTFALYIRMFRDQIGLPRSVHDISSGCSGTHQQWCNQESSGVSGLSTSDTLILAAQPGLIRPQLTSQQQPSTDQHSLSKATL